MTTSPLQLAQDLEAARLASGLTRQQLTERAGVSRQAVYRLFKGNDVQVSTLLAVMAVLQLDLLTLPRALQRSLPELRHSGRFLAREQLASFVPSKGTRSASHVMSAVQQRLASLNSVTAKPKRGKK
jgi:transcriptional regulator with XRE-family HTH domain